MSKSITCNPATGVCEVNLDINIYDFVYVAPKVKDKVIIEYFTDPACSACWALEPVLREFEEKYFDVIEVRYIMGGLFDKLSLSKEAANDFANSWEELGERFNMPINGDVMRNDPLTSSYPPSLAYLAAVNQDLFKAKELLRKIREALFVYAKKIDKEEVLIEIAKEVGLDVTLFLEDFYSLETLEKLESNIAYTIVNGVSGFPTVIMYGPNKPSMIIRSVRQLHDYTDALSNFVEAAPKKINYTLKEVFNHYNLLSTREVSELMNVYFIEDMEIDLNKLVEKRYLERIKVNNGYYWRRLSKS